MKTLLLSVVLLSSAIVYSGCQSGAVGDCWLYPQSKIVTNRDEVLKTLGGPSSVTQVNGKETYVYMNRQVQGGGFGLGHFGTPIIGFVNSQAATDTMSFVFEADGSLAERKPGVHGSATLERKFWPFDKK
jgi:hypothetical protein